MGGINVGRVVAGGLVAGLVINVGETILNAYVLADTYAERMIAYGVAESPYAVPIFTVYGFLLGIVAVWLYALARPRLGPGPRSAALVGLGVWLLYSGSFADFHLAVPLFPTFVPLWNLGWGLVEVPLATMAGAWVYREAADVRQVATTEARA